MDQPEHQPLDLSAMRGQIAEQLRGTEQHASYLRGQLAILDELIAHLQRQQPGAEAAPANGKPHAEAA